MALAEYIDRQMEWSSRTFGEGMRTEGLCKHIEKELAEIRKDPTDLMEWVDVIILALDGAWRAGYTPTQIVDGIKLKQVINIRRNWPAPGPQDQPSEHVKAA